MSMRNIHWGDKKNCSREKHRLGWQKKIIVWYLLLFLFGGEVACRRSRFRLQCWLVCSQQRFRLAAPSGASVRHCNCFRSRCHCVAASRRHLGIGHCRPWATWRSAVSLGRVRWQPGGVFQVFSGFAFQIYLGFILGYKGVQFNWVSNPNAMLLVLLPGHFP